MILRVDLLAQPAGNELLLNNSGKDISFLFKTLHPPGTLQKVRSLIKQVGTSPTQAAEPVDPVEQRRAPLFPPELVISCAESEDLAKEVLGEESAAWSFIYSWADDGACMPPFIRRSKSREGGRRTRLEAKDDETRPTRNTEGALVAEVCN
jgi:hypothetical protein